LNKLSPKENGFDFWNMMYANDDDNVVLI